MKRIKFTDFKLSNDDDINKRKLFRRASQLAKALTNNPGVYSYDNLPIDDMFQNYGDFLPSRKNTLTFFFEDIKESTHAVTINTKTGFFS